MLCDTVGIGIGGYTKVAERCIYPAKRLSYLNMGFGDDDMKVEGWSCLRTRCVN